jgi:hypothetical protein
MNHGSCLTNHYEESRTNLFCPDLSTSRMNSFLYLPRSPNISHNVEQLIVLCYSVCFHGNILLIFVAAETGVCVPLPSNGLSRHITPSLRLLVSP